MAKKKKTTKKSVKKGQKSARRVARKKTTGGARKTSGKRKKATKKAARGALPKNRTAAKKIAPAGKRGPARLAAVKRVGAGGASSPAGEVYGKESWREEELSAAELDADAPELEELEAELGPPEVAGEDEDDSEW